jgi:hypothetical protein
MVVCSLGFELPGPWQAVTGQTQVKCHFKTVLRERMANSSSERQGCRFGMLAESSAILGHFIHIREGLGCWR